MPNTFELRPDPSGGFDFYVDGAFLRSRVFAGQDQSRCHMTLMRRELEPGSTGSQIRRLTTETPDDFGANRVGLYYCPACFDAGCGVLTVKIAVTARSVRWSELGFERPFDPSDGPEDPEPLKGIGPFTFDRATYEAALNGLEEYMSRVFEELNSSEALTKPAMLGIGEDLTRRGMRTPVPRSASAWIIDGLPLSRILQKTLQRSHRSPARKKLAGLIHPAVQDSGVARGPRGRAVLETLLGVRRIEDARGRVPLLVGSTLDPFHGVVTAHLQRVGERVIWDEFQVHEGASPDPLHIFPTGIRFSFDRSQHDETIVRALETFTVHP